MEDTAMAAAPRLSVDTRSFSFHQTMIRVTDPVRAVDFFTKCFGMTLVDIMRFPEAQFDLYFLASLPDGEAVPTPGSREASRYLWRFPRTVLELTHNYGTEKAAGRVYWNGNEEPYRGFGHLGFLVDDPRKFCARLEAAGVKFHKRLGEGLIKSIAFVLEPSTGYWVEIMGRCLSLPRTEVAGKPLFQQAMIRVRDPAVSLPWYERHFGMSLVAMRHHPEYRFSLYFMATFPPGTPLPPDPESPAAWDYMCSLSVTCIEFTHNHGTEADPAFHYSSGNTDPGRGFGHVGFLVDDLAPACERLERDGVVFKKRPHEGRMRGFAFAADPDGYLVEIIQRGLERCSPAPGAAAAACPTSCSPASSSSSSSSSGTPGSSACPTRSAASTCAAAVLPFVGAGTALDAASAPPPVLPSSSHDGGGCAGGAGSGDGVCSGADSKPPCDAGSTACPGTALPPPVPPTS